MGGGLNYAPNNNWAMPPANSGGASIYGGYGSGNLGTSSVSFSTPQQIADFQRMSGGAAGGGSAGGGTSGPGTIDYSSFTGAIPTAIGYGNTVMNAAFDPQNALYKRTAAQLTDQTRAGLAARGLNTSGVGQGIEDQAMSNFNIDWQNNLLNRMATGAGAYSQLGGTAARFGDVSLNAANQGATWAQNRGYNQYSANTPGNTGMGSSFQYSGFAPPAPDFTGTGPVQPWSGGGQDYNAMMGLGGYTSPTGDATVQQPPDYSSYQPSAGDPSAVYGPFPSTPDYSTPGGMSPGQPQMSYDPNYIDYSSFLGF